MQNEKNCEYKYGSLPSTAPLAMSYVPMQDSSEPAYNRETAIARGTLFPGLDLPFMNMVNKPMSLNTPLCELMALDFVLQELSLYLDTHKDDEEAFTTYKSFLRLYNEGRSRYVELYGPISRDDMLQARSYTWLKSPWPWEYVEGGGR